MKAYWRYILVFLIAAALVAGYVLKRNTDYVRMDREARRVLKGPALVEPGSGKPMLLDLGAGTCIPCKQMQPILEALRKEYEGRVVVQIVDVNEHREWAQKYRIYLIPTQIFFDAGGNELFRHEGFFSREEILAKFKEYGWTR